MRKLPVFIIFSLVLMLGVIILAGCGEGGKQPPPAPTQQQGAATQEAPPAAAKPQSCYDVGFKIGRCAAKSMSNLPCEPGEDIPMPLECKGKPETKKGLAEGRKSVY
jgi:hypothetical protein